MKTLNEEQLEAIANIRSVIVDPSENFLVVSGGAGTGKTTVISEIRNNLEVLNKLLGDKWDMHITATTNKAVEVISSSLSVDAVTVFKLFGIRVSYGKLMFPKYEQVKIANAVVVIDEFSYVSEELCGFIHGLAKANNLKIIYFGDEYQLTPVNHNYVPVMERDYLVCELVKVMRQEHEELISLNEDLKLFVKDGVFPEVLKPTNNLLIYSEDEGDKFFDNLVSALNFGNSRFVSFTNKRVNEVNKALFNFIHMRNNFNSGDVLVNNKYFSVSRTQAIKTEEEVVVRSAHTTVITITGFSNKVYDIKGQHVNLVGVPVPLFVPDNPKHIKLQGSDDLSKELQARIRDTWIDLRPEYACTVHKSQGSTYEEVFVDLSDFKNVPDSELARLLYVALTRSRKRVHIFGDL